jgi:transcriptional regulator with XRE-family HTH domain
LDEDEPEPILAPAIEATEPESRERSDVHVAGAIRMLRQRNGMSQRQLALRMGVPRTYVSKIENEKAIPTLSSLERLAQALEVTVYELLCLCGPSREEEIQSLLADPFLAELAEFTRGLNAMQMSSIVAQVRDIVSHPRRVA